MEDSTDSILQDTLILYSDTLKDAFIHVDGKIGDLPDLKKQAVALEIKRRWVKNTIEYGARKVALLGGDSRMEQGW